ncbi:hypothetical protein MICRO11B_60009 [Micrococcus luteus]|nr:hypothetical protein MICRO11B_60009 [Micrococcus luteus]
MAARHRHGGPVVHGGRDGGHPRHHGLARAERGRALRGCFRERANLRRSGRLRRRVRPPQPDDPAHRPRGPRGLAGALPPRRRRRGLRVPLADDPGACDPPTPARWPRPGGAVAGHPLAGIFPAPYCVHTARDWDPPLGFAPSLAPWGLTGDRKATVS